MKLSVILTWVTLTIDYAKHSQQYMGQNSAFYLCKASNRIAGRVLGGFRGVVRCFQPVLHPRNLHSTIVKETGFTCKPKAPFTSAFHNDTPLAPSKGSVCLYIGV
jgi:hypothetical protein